MSTCSNLLAETAVPREATWGRLQNWLNPIRPLCQMSSFTAEIWLWFDDVFVSMCFTVYGAKFYMAFYSKKYLWKLGVLHLTPFISILPNPLLSCQNFTNRPSSLGNYVTLNFSPHKKNIIWNSRDATARNKMLFEENWVDKGFVYVNDLLGIACSVVMNSSLFL